jgi:spore maturation protein CgeB
MRAGWHLRALPEYDTVFTPRRANIGDLRALGCRDVRYLPFGYDETLCRPPERPLDGARPDVLFVGGADPDRVEFMAEFIRVGPRVTLVGSYWERYGATRDFTLGQKPPEEVAALTAAAKVNLCLVRRANRDGHVMRSYEMAAIGACMLVEDTEEHRDIFGPDGEAVTYFRSPGEAAQQSRALLADDFGRAQFIQHARDRICNANHTYRHRLSDMTNSVGQKKC